MKAKTIAGAAAIIAATAGVASATSAQNSIQPSHIRFGTVQSGTHPTRMATLHNGTGATQTIGVISLAGSGGYKFTLGAGTTCVDRLVLQPGASCDLNVRVHTKATGWWRSVLRVAYASGWNNSASVQAHVVD